jgi:hypothetical protein
MYGVKQFARDAAGIVALAAVLAVVSWRTFQRLPGVDQAKDPVRTALCDFRDVVYFPARAAAAGTNPYDAHPRADGRGYRDLYPAGNPIPLYGPLVLVVSLPFAALPLLAAQVAFWALNVVLLLVFSFVVLRIGQIDANVGFVCGLSAILLLSRPGHANLYFGQITLPMILATLGAWHFALARPTLSGLLLSVAMIKPTYGVPLAILMLLTGYYRAAWTGIALTAAISLALFALLFVRDTGGAGPLELLAKNQSHVEDDPNVHPRLTGSRIDLPMVTERAFGDAVAPLARWLLPLVVLAIGGWSLRRLCGLSSETTTDASVIAISLVCLTIAICIYHGIYDGLLVTIPAVAAWSAVLNKRAFLPAGWNLPLAMFLSVPALNYFTSKQFVSLLSEWLPALMSAGEGAEGTLWSALCMLNGLALGAAWCILLLAGRQKAARAS